jgi:hypothetical protein
MRFLLKIRGSRTCEEQITHTQMSSTSDYCKRVLLSHLFDFDFGDMWVLCLKRCTWKSLKTKSKRWERRTRFPESTITCTTHVEVTVQSRFDLSLTDQYHDKYSEHGLIFDCWKWTCFPLNGLNWFHGVRYSYHDLTGVVFCDQNSETCIEDSNGLRYRSWWYISDSQIYISKYQKLIGVLESCFCPSTRVQIFVVHSTCYHTTRLSPHHRMTFMLNTCCIMRGVVQLILLLVKYIVTNQLQRRDIFKKKKMQDHLKWIAVLFREAQNCRDEKT